eukprot:5049007-Alexandrium_andersonii.AAC.1
MVAERWSTGCSVSPRYRAPLSPAMAGAPQHPPGLEPEAPRPKRSRAASVGATPSASSAPTSASPTAISAPA